MGTDTIRTSKSFGLALAGCRSVDGMFAMWNPDVSCAAA
jgi:hypothetical protein